MIMFCRSATLIDKPQEQRRLLALDIPLCLLGQLSELPYVLDDVLHGRMVIMELLLELLWCTIPAHAQSEKQYNFKEKVCKTTVQYTFYHIILLPWIYALPVQDSLRPCFSLCRLTLPCRIFWKLPFSGPVLISPAVSRHDTLRTGHLRNNLIAIKLSLDLL